jgi:ubiquinone biosynthesis protein
MVVVEGVARSLDPKLDMWKTADPVVREWIARNLGPLGRIEDVAGGAGEIGKFLGTVPAMLTRAADLADRMDALTRNGFVLSPETIEAIGRAEAHGTRWRTAGIWALVALFGWIVILLR